MPPTSDHTALAAVVAHLRAGRVSDAETLYRQTLTPQPPLAEVLHQLGCLASQVNCHRVALDLMRRSVALQPNFFGAQYSLGDALRNNNQLDEAIAAYQRSIALNPDYVNAHNNLGNALRDKGWLDAAIACYRTALELSPDFPEALINLGDLLRLKGQTPEAVTCLERAVAISPDNPVAHSLLGLALHFDRRVDEAIVHYRRALAMEPPQPQTTSPHFAQAHSNLGGALLDVGQIEHAILHYRRAIAPGPGLPNATLTEAHSNLLFTLNYLHRFNSPEIFQEHQRWEEQHCRDLRNKIQPHPNDRSPDRRLRIGYVSGDFKAHSIAYFLEGLLTDHDPAAVEVFCYSNVVLPDAITARFRRLAHQWCDTVKLSNERLAAKIREDQIDILVDLAGHTAENRLLTFAEKPAPIQVTYLGYPNTTALTTIDYRLTDAYADPPGLTEQFHTEKLVRLPQTFLCFRPPEESPPIASLPAQSSGHITFGSFNALPKITPEMIAVWSAILERVPKSRLLLKNKGLGERSARQHLLKLFADVGIHAHRLDVRDWVGLRRGHLQIYDEVDIALDTYPYNGTTTTCEALWMGVPVLTLAGNSHRSRVGVSILSNVGLPQLIGQTPDQFIQLAADVAGDLPHLAQLRAGLRDRMKQSPLTNSPLFTRNIESAYRQMWHTWCQTHATS
jgi:predicted O-linked N-acetylglucosamine transferase (SPINDLY family)